MDPFVSDVKKIREKARQHMEKGAVTEGYKADTASGRESFERGARD
jgi:hypothetical protein